MIDVFQVVGKYVVNTSSAIKSIDEITDKAQSSTGLINKAFKGMQTATVIAGKAIVAGVGASATAIGAITKSAVSAYGEYEQLSQGAMLMFGDAYSTVAENAKNAYMTVQMSQSDYLKEVNKFSTGLRMALGGDAQASAELAHRIITAEADVVAATGQSAEMVQNAFNGIMRNNYVMLDNLQLGIKPTKEGFQELIDTVNEWNNANGKATNYQIDNLADAQNALVDYIEMVGYSGYANMEASKTITGSMMAVKATWSNVMVGLADENQDLSVLIENFINTLVAMLENIMPRIKTTFQKIPEFLVAIAPFVVDAVGTLLPSLITSAIGLVQGLISALPSVLSQLGTFILEQMNGIFSMISFSEILAKFSEYTGLVVQWFGGIGEAITQNLPTIVSSAMGLITMLVDNLAINAPQLLSAGIGLISNIGQGMINALPILLAYLPQILETFEGMFRKVSATLTKSFDLTGILNKISEITDGAIAWIENLGTTLQGKIPEFIQKLLPMVLELSQKLLEEAPKLIEAGMGFIANIVQGVIDALPDLINYVPEIITNVANAFSNSMAVIFAKGAEILWNIIQGIVSAIPDLLTNIWDIINMILAVWTAMNWWELGSKLMNGILGSIQSLSTNFKQYIDNFFNGIFNIIKGIWDSASRSTKGIWQGLYDTVKMIAQTMFNSIKNTFTNTLSTVTNIFNNIKNAIQNPIQTAVDFVKRMIDKVRSFFNFTWSLPHLKLPHVKISGSFSLLPPSVPHFSIEWYKKGGILEQPTAFGINPSTGNIMAGGEAGKEAIAPISELMGYVRTAVAEANGNSAVLEVLTAILNIISDYDRLRDIFIEALNEAGFSVILDGREVGRLVKKYA